MKAIISLCIAFASAALIAQPSRSEEVQDFYIKTVHLDGNTSTKADADHPAEPFPTAPLPDGGGSS